ncbi:FkbM family methyltransferase [Litoribacter ruber]|uniref:FkbM family methyltransferase n=1 Tax=Litoribacter ruber TaxID=702568 RepID=UPI001BD55B4E|nr:FkbM family methyltransferase [Litoribacter alkaliphilus]
MTGLLKRRVLNKAAFWISYIKLIPILRKVNQFSLVIDCGANVGDISALFLKKEASVIAFEPDPIAYKMLQTRFKDEKNMQLINKAVDHQNSVAKLYFHMHQQESGNSAFTVSSSIIGDKKNINLQDSIEIETVDLDSFISNLDQPVDILKMDVEGAEIEILHKLIQNETYKKIGILLVETHETKIPGHIDKVAELKATIRRLKIDNIKLNWV